MGELLQLFSLVSLIMTHPLEQLSLNRLNFQEEPVIFTQSSRYIAPSNGFVKSIFENDGIFQIILSLDDGNEVVYSGLREITKKTGDRVIANEPIGIDITISPNTKFVLMFYEESELFPQFLNNDLAFITERRSSVYTATEGIVISTSYEQSGAGMITKIKLAEKDIYISYLHLMLFEARTDDIVAQGDRIAYSGNTGDSESPRLVLRIEGEELGNDIRVIYFRVFRK